MAETFQEFIKGERTRLNGERRALVKQQGDIAKQLVDVDRELAAIAAYETTKTGKASKPTAKAAPRKGRATRKASTGGRRGSKREPILKLIADNPSGLSRGEILQKMGIKGNRAGEMSVSNALTALTKGNQVARKDGKYVPASA